MADPSDDDLKGLILEQLPKVDLNNTGVKAFMKIMSAELGGIDLRPRKAFITQVLSEAINEMNNKAQAQEESEEEEDVESEVSDEEEEVVVPKRKKAKAGGGGGGLKAQKEISDELAAFLGKGKYMCRTEVVKLLWEYIREHDLQNPENRREILLDEAMKNVFGCKTFTMFTMNKYIGAHIEPYKPVDLTSTPTPRKRKMKGSSGKSKDKKKRKAGTQPPFRLSPELVDVVGKEILPRPQVVSELWVYIKSNSLQNPANKREILCDDKLKAIFNGKDKVTMFNMNQFISHHLIEKVDRSAYHHEVDDYGSD